MSSSRHSGPSASMPALAGGVSVRWIPSSDAGSAERTWRVLEPRVSAGGLTSSWVWTGTWLEHYGDLVPHRFAVGEAAGRSCGIALVTGSAERRWPRPRSVHLGTAGEPRRDSVFVEYNRILVEPGQRAAFAAALLAALHGDPAWHQISLDGFAPEDAAPLLAAEPRLQARREICWTTDLREADAVGGEVLGMLRRNTRTMVRRSLRGLGAVQTEWAETPEHALDILDELVALHQARWVRAGQPGAFASPRFAGFHRALVPRLARTGDVILFRARAAAGTVGCVYAFVDRGRVLFYQSGLASYADRQIRPGFVAHALCMQSSYERGLKEYDFLAGDSRYKRELSTRERELVWATWRRPALRWQVMDELVRLRRQVRAVARRAGAGPRSGARSMA
jgi:hypothetical protein